MKEEIASSMWSPPSKTKKLPTEALRVKANIDEDPSLSQHCRRTQNRGVCNEATETNSGLDEHREHRKDGRHPTLSSS